MPRRGRPPRFFPTSGGGWLPDIGEQLNDWWVRLEFTPSPDQRDAIESAIRLFLVAKSCEKGVSLREMERRVQKQTKRQKAGLALDDAIVIDQVRRQAGGNFDLFVCLIKKERELIDEGGEEQITLMGAEPTYIYLAQIRKAMLASGYEINLSNRWNELSDQRWSCFLDQSAARIR